MGYELPIYVTNGEVAWEIPKRIGRRLLDGVYDAFPDGWGVSNRRLGTEWIRGILGEMRLNQVLKEGILQND